MLRLWINPYPNQRVITAGRQELPTPMSGERPEAPEGRIVTEPTGS